MLIAEQSGESPRRVRARLEKQGLMDSLRNQIIERKVIELVLSPRQVQGRALTSPKKRHRGDLDRPRAAATARREHSGSQARRSEEEPAPEALKQPD